MILCFTYQTQTTIKTGDCTFCCFWIKCWISQATKTTVSTYSFLRADFLFSSLSSWAASLSLTSEPGALAGIISSCSSLLWTGDRGFCVVHNRHGGQHTDMWRICFLFALKWNCSLNGAIEWFNTREHGYTFSTCTYTLSMAGSFYILSLHYQPKLWAKKAKEQSWYLRSLWIVCGVHSQPCWSRKKCRAPFPDRFGICPCGEKSPGNACLLKTPISLSPVHGRVPCHRTHLPAGSTALLALWFAVNRETLKERRKRWEMAAGRQHQWKRDWYEREREREKELGVFDDGHNSLFSDTITVTVQWGKRTIHCPGNGPHGRTQDCANNQTTKQGEQQAQKYSFCPPPTFLNQDAHDCNTYLCSDLEVFMLF